MLATPQRSFATGLARFGTFHRFILPRGRFHKPHDPFVAPAKYFDFYPPDKLRLNRDPENRSPELRFAVPDGWKKESLQSENQLSRSCALRGRRPVVPTVATVKPRPSLRSDQHDAIDEDRVQRRIVPVGEPEVRSGDEVDDAQINPAEFLVERAVFGGEITVLCY